MINQQELTGGWIQQVAARHKADPLLAEKVIRALLLLEGLAKQKLAFVFKGRLGNPAAIFHPDKQAKEVKPRSIFLLV